MKRREPAILKLSQTYNSLCKQMAQLIEEHRAPQSAVAPEPIKSDGLFKLDVDDDIWQDIGLEDDISVGGESSHSPPVPRWLGDESVRSGIKAQLTVDRCKEELDRLSLERCILQQWMQEEWRNLENAVVPTR